MDDVVAGRTRGSTDRETVTGMWRKIEMGDVHRAASFSFAFCKLPKIMAWNQSCLARTSPAENYLLQGGLNCRVVPGGHFLCQNYNQFKVIPMPHPVNLFHSFRAVFDSL